ncbi:MAG: hypothetical protein AB1489_05780 [Acidobacteriota bacterium]
MLVFIQAGFDLILRLMLFMVEKTANQLGVISNRLFAGRPCMEQARTYWKACAARRGLSFHTSPPREQPYLRLYGNYRGYSIHMQTGLPFAATWSTVQACFPISLEEGLHIYPEDGFSRQLPASMRGDILVGDRAFDDAFVVKGGFDNSVRRRLNPMVRYHLMKLWQTLEMGDQFEMNDYCIIYQFPKLIENPEELMPLIDAMADVIDAICAHRQQLFVKSVSLAERCEICHQVDAFNLELSYCHRCDHLSR